MSFALNDAKTLSNTLATTALRGGAVKVVRAYAVAGNNLGIDPAVSKFRPSGGAAESYEVEFTADVGPYKAGQRIWAKVTDLA